LRDKPLPQNGPEKKIFLRALRDYSDHCDLPDLTPDCPFYRRSADGPVCSDECKDLLADYEADHPSLEVVGDLGAGYEIVRKRRPRPRHPRSDGERPFDVTVISREDENLARPARRTTSIVNELRQYLVVPPWLHPDPSERSYAIDTCKDILISRGVDVEGLIRYAIAPSIGMGVAMGLLLADDSLDELPGETASIPEKYERWSTLLTERQSGDDPNIAGLQLPIEFLEGVRRWATTAKLSGIEGWDAPDQFPAEESAVDDENIDVGCWVLDRFATTYLADWRLRSLQLEWRYQHGQRRSPMEPSRMPERPINLRSLADLIAERTSLESDSGGGQAKLGKSALSVEDFTPVAVENIQVGKIEVATGIFQACIAADPSNAEAHNNFGFCLIPTDPEGALASLQRAQQLGYGVESTNVANQMLALHLIGRDDEARALSIDVTAPSVGYVAWLWRHTSYAQRLEIQPFPDTLNYIEDLMTHIDRGCAPR
jgi:hypothetical protein